jgi:hypothetical protein
MSIPLWIPQIDIDFFRLFSICPSPTPDVINFRNLFYLELIQNVWFFCTIIIRCDFCCPGSVGVTESTVVLVTTVRTLSTFPRNLRSEAPSSPVYLAGDTVPSLSRLEVSHHPNPNQFLFLRYHSSSCSHSNSIFSFIFSISVQLWRWFSRHRKCSSILFRKVYFL